VLEDNYYTIFIKFYQKLKRASRGGGHRWKLFLGSIESSLRKHPSTHLEGLRSSILVRYLNGPLIGISDVTPI
jgi:hypothetical protein